MQSFLTRPRPLSFYLFALCAALTIPILVVTGFMTWRFADSEQLRLKHAVEESGQQIAFAVDQQMAADLSMLNVLASSSALRYGDFTGFIEQVERVVGQHASETSLVLRSADRGIVLVSVGKRPFDAAELNALYTERMVSDFVRGATFQDSAYYLTVPVLVDGELRYWLHGRMSAARLPRLLEAQHLRQGYFASIVDRNGFDLDKPFGIDGLHDLDHG